ncbi:MAG: CvpA family protein [Chitinophagaceae bacterium]
MNWVDLLLILIIFFSVLSGFYKGFIIGAINLIAWVGSLVTGYFFYPYVAQFIEKYLPFIGVWTLPLAFLTTIIIARILLEIILNPILRMTSSEAHYSGINKFLGIVPGFFNGLINAIIASILLLATPIFDGLSNQTRNSKIVAELTPPAEWLQEKLSPVFDKAVNKTMTKLTVEPNSNETVQLHFTINKPKIREDLEAKMLQLVNDERTKRGLKPLVFDSALTEVARAHSADMLARGYFSHYTPEGKDPFDRMKEAGIKYTSAGENLALAPTLSIAHDGLMNSPGHRANILNPAFGRVGIGILDGGIYGLMISQEFKN